MWHHLTPHALWQWTLSPPPSGGGVYLLSSWIWAGSWLFGPLGVLQLTSCGLQDGSGKTMCLSPCLLKYLSWQYQVWWPWGDHTVRKPRCLSVLQLVGLVFESYQPRQERWSREKGVPGDSNSQPWVTPQFFSAKVQILEQKEDIVSVVLCKFPTHCICEHRKTCVLSH